MTAPQNETNAYGTPVTRFVCQSCGMGFTVCPAVTEDQYDQWLGCMAEDCPSYEPMRDADLYLYSGMIEVE